MGLTYITSCAVCGQKFTTPSFEDLLATDSGKAQLGGILDALHKHFEMAKDEKHRAAFAGAMLPGMQLGRLIVLSNFRSNDEAANAMREYMRHSLFKTLQQRTIPDDKIIDQVRNCATPKGKKLPAEFHSTVIALVQQMRDILEEKGNFEPKPPGPAQTPKPLLVTP